MKIGRGAHKGLQCDPIKNEAIIMGILLGQMVIYWRYNGYIKMCITT